MNQPRRSRGMSIIFMIIMIVAMYLLFQSLAPKGQQYYEIIDLFQKDKVSEFSLNEYNGHLTYKLRGETEKEYTYSVARVDLFLQDVLPTVKEYNVQNPSTPIKYDIITQASFLSILLAMLPTLLLGGALVFVFILMSRQQGGGGMISNFGKAKARSGNQGRKYTFDDVAGADEEKEELSEIVEFLRSPEKFNTLGARIPKGVLLVGPPGTGKTLLAKAVAGEAGVPFLSISGSDFVELYVGIGASRVRDLFEQAKKKAPSIVFIDEIDAVGRQRGAGLGGGHDEREQTLNQLLVEMDGFEENLGVIIIAATNRPDVLDHALLRPGRFDRQIYVALPDVKGREEILKVHARGKPLGPDVDLNTIAKSTIGFTGADLENVLNQAALLAARLGKKAITEADIEEATTRVLVGPEKRSKVVTERERNLTAFHEAGHAIVTHFAQPETPVHQISIIPRGRTGGFTMSLPTEDTSFDTKNEMENEITSLLGGRVAEQLELKDISTGASNDLERATRIARSMVTKYGFSEKLGPVVWSSEQDEVFLGRDFAQNRNYSEQIASDIDLEMRKIIDACYKNAQRILTEHNDKLKLLANTLLEKETIGGEDFRALITA